MKKIVAIIISIILLNSGLSIARIAYTESLEEATFDVTEVLTLPDGQQQQKYLGADQPQPIAAFILEVIEFATTIIGSIAIIILIIAGFMFMLAQGNDQRISEAKDMVKYTIIGLIIAFLSYIIVLFIQSLFIAQ